MNLVFCFRLTIFYPRRCRPPFAGKGAGFQPPNERGKGFSRNSGVEGEKFCGHSHGLDKT
jgi:hypothetical protein